MPQYQGVWTVEQQAQALTNQQWVTDPNFNNTTLLLQADGTGSGSQNQTFLDGSTNNFFITRNGNTTQGSFSPFSQAPGYWSNYFSTSPYLSVASNTAFDFGSGDATQEMWIYPTTASQNAGLFDKRSSGANYSQFPQITLESGVLKVYVSYTGSSWAVQITGATPTPNTWSHIALVRSGNTWTLYVNGVASGTPVTASGSVYASTDSLCIGASATNGTNPFTGYISNARIIKGTALYTSSFTPSATPLTAISGTSLLTCQSNRFVDNSTNNFTIILNSTVSVQAFGPFAPALQWTPDVVGGSGYFDGTGDSLTVASSAAFAYGTGAITIQFWIYGTLNSSVQAWVTNGSNNLNIQRSSGGFYNVYDGTDRVSTTTVIPNQWNHVAFVRQSGGQTNLYANGVSVLSWTSSVNYANDTFLVSGSGSFPFTGYVSGLQVLKGTAVYTANFTPPIAPPTAITNTQLLLNYTNAGIYDGKMANNLETVGNAQVSTSVVKYGSGSIYFDGSGDSLLTTSNAIFSLGSSDFTVEFWLYPISTNYGAIMYSTNNGSKTDAFAIYAYGSGQSPANSIVALITNSGGAAWSLMNGSSFGLTTAGAWQHVALVRNGSTFKGYLNGVAGFTVTSTSAIAAFNGFSIASNGASGDYFNGYIDDLRITRAARYFANFTPPQQALPRQ